MFDSARGLIAALRCAQDGGTFQERPSVISKRKKGLRPEGGKRSLKTSARGKHSHICVYGRDFKKFDLKSISIINSILYVSPQQKIASRIAVHRHFTRKLRRCNRKISENHFFIKTSFLPARMQLAGVANNRVVERSCIIRTRGRIISIMDESKQRNERAER